MRVENKANEAAKPQPKASFKQQLQKALAPHAPKPQPKPAAKPAVQQQPKAQQPPAKPKLAQPQGAHAFVDKLAARRADAERARPDVKQVAQKLAGLLEHPREHKEHREPERSVSPMPAPSVVPQALAPQQVAPVQSAPPPTLASQIEKLVEHAELIARAEGPALQLGLHEGRAAQIEVIRVGKGEVALRLSARTPGDRRALAAQAKEIRAALAERGLRVRELTVG